MWTKEMVRNGMLMLVAVLVLVTIPSFIQISTGQETTETEDDPNAMVPLVDDHEDPNDYIWDSSSVVRILLADEAITVNGSGATVDGNTITIDAAGTYDITGLLTDGQILVDSKDKKLVRLILSGINVGCSWSAPLYVKNAKKAVIILPEETENYLTDARDYVIEDPNVDEPNAVLFSKEDLSIWGTGTGRLTVIGDVNDGISSKDGLVIAGGVIEVNAVDDGIRGKDYLVVRGGTITVISEGDGLKSDNEEDADKGYISIEGGELNITSGTDAIQAANQVIVTDGQIAVTSGGGSRNRRGAVDSSKGIKAAVSAAVDGGILTIDSVDDAIHSDGNLRINGGVLTLLARGDAMHAGATIEINGGDTLVSKSSEGIDANNVTINDGTLQITSDDDGIHAAESISIVYGLLNIVSGTDAIEAETDLTITDGDFVLSSGGGSNVTTTTTTSAKAIKAGTNLTIDAGNFTIDTADDGVHSNENVTINGGTFTITAKDDGVHANADLLINDGQINITRSYEGLESTDGDITINGGVIHVVSSDDGINGAGGGDGMNPGGPGGPGNPGGGTSTPNCYLYVNGGYISVQAVGDGIDINGAVVMTDGVVVVNGPTANMNGALDYDVSFRITGGYLLAAGSSGMAQAPDTSSTQNSVLVTFRSTLQAGTLFHIQAKDGTNIVTFAPTKTYQSVAFSSPALVRGASYDVYYGGSTTGTATDGLYEGGTYTPGTRFGSFTVTSALTNVR